MKHNVLGMVGLAGALALLVLFAMPSYRQGEPGFAGRRPYDFTFDLDGKPTRLSDLRGKVVVLNFWATWCPPCVEEMPSLNALHAQIEPRGGLVLGISVDDDEEAYKRFLPQHNIIFPTYRDTTKSIAPTYGTTLFPETYLIGRDGRIARKVVGPQDWQSPEMVSVVNALLADN